MLLGSIWESTTSLCMDYNCYVKVNRKYSDNDSNNNNNNNNNKSNRSRLIC